MTPDTEAIRERLEKVTKGPWFTARHNDYTGRTVVETEEDRIADFSDMIGGQQDEYNADFTAHAPADIATLLAENERLNAALALATRTERERCAKIARDYPNRFDGERIARFIEANHGE